MGKPVDQRKKTKAQYETPRKKWKRKPIPAHRRIRNASVKQCSQCGGEDHNKTTCPLMNFCHSAND